MLKLDNNLLEELGLGSLPETQKRQMLQHIYDTLELRVGTQLANQMTDKQLEEFEKFIDAGGDANQAQALQWLEANLPNYKDVVQQTFDALKVEVKSMAPQLLTSAAQQPQEAQIVSQQPITGPTQPQAYASPAQQPYGTPPMAPPSPQQVMPSQQTPVDPGQQWQASTQPMPASSQPSSYAQAQPYAPAAPVNPPQPQDSPVPPTTDPYAAPPTQFSQPSPVFSQPEPQNTPTPPSVAPSWQPQPPVQPWQPGPPTDQQPPQAA